MSEPKISINGTSLTDAQAMTLRVAVTDLHSRMSNPGALGEDETGEGIRVGYVARSREIADLMLTPPPSSHVAGLTISAAEVKALLYGVPKYEFSTALSRLAAWLAENDDETPTPPGNQIRTAECDGKDAVPTTGQLPVGTASPRLHVVGFFGDLLMALSRLAGNRNKDGVSSTISREDRETIINGCHDLMIAVRQAPAPNEHVAVPEGWKMVPVTPTEKMDEAGYGVDTGRDGNHLQVWSRMVGAAPSKPED